MSHIEEIKVQINSLNSLEKAAKRLGGVLVKNVKDYKWYGTFVGDTQPDLSIFTKQQRKNYDAMPEHAKKAFVQDVFGTCDHKISFPALESWRGYEVGVKIVEGNIKLVWDYYDTQLMNHLGGQAAPLLVQAAGIESQREIAELMGYTCVEETLKNGTIALTVNV